MLSIAALTGGPSYYLQLASVSYYTLGGEPPPIWAGTVAKELELSGLAELDHVEKLCAGFHHETGEGLVRNAGEERRNPGHDLTFSAPKSVSVAWAAADPELRAAIQASQLKAVRRALAFLEEKAGRARIGAQGQEIVRCPLLFALFEHGTSRAQDPQLHTHAVLINLTMHPDGRTTAIDSTYLYHFKMAGGAVYRAALAEELKKLGFSIEQRKLGASIGFEIRGVPGALVEEFSKRRAEIERLLDLRKGGLDTADPRYAELVCKETRRTKEADVGRGELFERWQEVAKAFGVGDAFIRGLLEPGRTPTPAERRALKDEVWQGAVQALSDQYSHWNEADLTKAVAERSAGKLSVADLRELIENKMRSPELCDIGLLRTERKHAKFRQYVDRSEVRFTTPEILQLERRMLGHVEQIIRGPRSDTANVHVEKVIRAAKARGDELDPEQMLAVRHLTSGTGVRLLTGLAGTGKTTALKAAVAVWKSEDPGRKILGCAVAGAAEENLQRGVGPDINCHTLKSLLWQLDNGRLKLDSKSVVIVDEAGMVGTRQLASLVEHIKSARGCRLILVGDAKQLQPIEAGGPFKYLAEALGASFLSTIRRQDLEWMREAVKDMEAGRSDAALKAYIENGCFHLSTNRERAIDELLKRWQADGGIEDPKKVFLLASLNVEVKEINAKAQTARILAGQVDPERGICANGTFYHVGDRIQFQAKSKLYGLQNSDCGEVRGVDAVHQRLLVKLDKDGREVEVDLKRYSAANLRLGYASTTHKAQGASLPHVHVLIGGPLSDLHMGYVQLSRSIKSTHVFCDLHTAGGPKMADLIRSLAKERQKTVAMDVVDGQKPRRERAAGQLRESQDEVLRRHSMRL